MTKVIPLISFTDKTENKRRYADIEFETSNERAKKLVEKGVCKFSEEQPIKEEARLIKEVKKRTRQPKK